jgi:thiamine-monophosphate kinase
MRLRDLGEFGLIERIERAAQRLGKPACVRIGIGDDAAVLRPRSGEDVVLSTDALVEGVHFRFEIESARSIGRRALVANLSDLAAMGARPLGFTFALAAPAHLPVSRVDGFVAGLLQESSAHGCALVGGNVSAAREVSITLSVLGAVARGRALTRRGACVGDRLFVTGVLGASALARLRAQRRGGRMRHVPVPRLGAGRTLARISAVSACIDVSDGLSADARHLLAPEGLEAAIDFDSLPRAARFAAECARLGVDAREILLAGGEDYELLFAVRGARPSTAELQRRLGIPVSRIGVVVPAGTDAPKAAPQGWRHF